MEPKTTDDIVAHNREWAIDKLESAELVGDKIALYAEFEEWIELDGEKLDVYHCPGHTPGHVIFHHVESKLAIVGDVLFQGSVGRTDLPGGNMEALISAIREKLLPLGDDITFIPGHGPISTLGQERLTNPFVADQLFKKSASE